MPRRLPTAAPSRASLATLMAFARRQHRLCCLPARPGLPRCHPLIRPLRALTIWVFQATSASPRRRRSISNSKCQALSPATRLCPTDGQPMSPHNCPCRRPTNRQIISHPTRTAGTRRETAGLAYPPAQMPRRLRQTSPSARMTRTLRHVQDIPPRAVRHRRKPTTTSSKLRTHV